MNWPLGLRRECWGAPSLRERSSQLAWLSLCTREKLKTLGYERSLVLDLRSTEIIVTCEKPLISASAGNVLKWQENWRQAAGKSSYPGEMKALGRWGLVPGRSAQAAGPLP